METFCKKPLLPSASRQIKIETSPTDSLLSDPSEVYPSLFSGSSAASSAAATPTDTGDDEINDFDLDASAFKCSLSAEEAMGDLKALALADQETTTDKKSTKKRKSWGQVLPEPKTNLPPRKRAKTEDEKEQRRVERVLRNRRAAQSSRERKRLEVEALEIRNRELEEQLAKVRRENSMLYEQLTHVQGKSAVASNANAPVTLSQELFKAQNGCLFTTEAESGLGPLLSSATINPVSLSPALHPIPDTSDHSPTIDTSLDKQEPIVRDHFSKTSQQIQGELFPEKKQGQLLLSEPVAANASDSSVTAELDISPDTTHRPAVTLCPDLQCLSGELSQAWSVTKNSTLLRAILLYQTTVLLMLSSKMISACSQPLNQIALLLNAGTSIPPTPAILTTIIWLITTPSRRSTAQNSILTSSSTPTYPISHPDVISSLTTVAPSRPSRPSITLRLRLLRKILTCNPMLARPIRDATMRVLRSVSEKQSGAVKVEGQVCSGVLGAAQWEETGIAYNGSWSNEVTRPSKEKLLTLLWALSTEERRMSMHLRRQSRLPRGLDLAPAKHPAKAGTNTTPRDSRRVA